MKETTSKSEWVGKVITCSTCNRSYEIEAGDEIHHGYMRGNSRMRISMPTRFEMPCGHYWPLPVSPNGVLGDSGAKTNNANAVDKTT